MSPPPDPGKLTKVVGDSDRQLKIKDTRVHSRTEKMRF
jgi:hypothetical protein